jgi:prepilin-type N-terminal cleavage/methylation domain-containing protein
MVFKSSKPFFRRWWLKKTSTAFSRSDQQGFTLIELLIAMVVGSIIIGSLLYVVVELLQINRREELLTQTQQDMRRAIDYIGRDVSEAIFVYADPADIVSQITDPPQNDPDAIPVLAFWRLDPLSQRELDALEDIACAGATADRCETLKVRQSTYTLVVYYYAVNEENPSNIWGGPARIIRYELPQYVNLRDAKSPFAQRRGYSDPSLSGDFSDWTRDGNETLGIKAVLTDFVDTGGDDPECGNPNFVVSEDMPDSFYTCVLAGDVDADEILTLRANQSVRVFLRGNAQTNRFGIAAFSDSGRLPALESEILIRGVLQRQPPGS